jgi:phage repressor protein C with HTH and peptisase S24 domain
MRGFGERLRRRARELDMSDAAVAKKAGLTPRRYTNYVNNDREPDLLTLLTISKVLRTTPDWLLGITEESDTISGRPITGHAGDIVEYSGDNYAAISSYDVTLSAGGGAEVWDEAATGKLLFPMGALRAMTRAKVGELAIVHVDGDSMEPTLRSGDQLLLDTTQRHPSRKDGLYALRYDGGLQVKRVSVHPQTHKLSIRSDNPAYPSHDDIDPSQIDVVARVIWIGRRV